MAEGAGALKYRPKMSLKDWLVLIGMFAFVAGVIAIGAYQFWLDVQWKRAIIERRAP